LGAVVLWNGKVVGKGFNKKESHAWLKRKYGHYSKHAECVSLMRASKGDTLIVVRILKNGEFSCSKPCEKCMKFIRDYGIKKVYYIDWDLELKEIKI